MSDPISTKTLSDTQQLLARGAIYRALSILLRHPSFMNDKAFLEEEMIAWQQAFEILEISNKEKLEKLMGLIVCRLKKISRKEWVYQYESNFGHTVQSLVPSYELEYGEEHSHRQPQQLGDIAAFYQAFGLKSSGQIHERVDHVAVECEFMQYLIFKELYALQHNNNENILICQQAAVNFLSNHLGHWLPSFAFRLAKASGEDLFKYIADFALYFIVEDCRKLGIEVGPNNLPLRAVNEKIDAGCVSCSLNPENQH